MKQKNDRLLDMPENKSSFGSMGINTKWEAIYSRSRPFSARINYESVRVSDMRMEDDLLSNWVIIYEIFLLRSLFGNTVYMKQMSSILWLVLDIIVVLNEIGFMLFN